MKQEEEKRMEKSTSVEFSFVSKRVEQNRRKYVSDDVLLFCSLKMLFITFYILCYI